MGRLERNAQITILVLVKSQPRLLSSHAVTKLRTEAQLDRIETRRDFRGRSEQKGHLLAGGFWKRLDRGTELWTI